MDRFEAYPAMLWEPADDKAVQCKLCPWRCKIAPGKRGICQVRENRDGKLYSLNYHAVCAANIDPIEKKPLFHFQVGSLSYSVACIGCNFQCQFCQNWQISQMPRDSGQLLGASITPQRMVAEAIKSNCKSIAYTYTEPTVYFELAYETAKLAHEKGLKNVFVSNGYITTEALQTIKPYLDGMNVDLKSFRDEFYRTVCKGRLQPVLDSLKWLVRNGVWVEVTTLVVPGNNDSEDELKDIAEFIAAELGKFVPWHVSRYHPAYQFDSAAPTPLSTVERALKIGREAGLRYCYGGNVGGHRSENTYCYACGKLLISRRGFLVDDNQITADNRCPACNAKIDGIEIAGAACQQGKTKRSE